MTDTDSKVGSVDLLRDVITRDRKLPAGYDGWLLRSVHPDLRSSRGYRYPFPGQVAEAPGPILDHDGACPGAVGDGICAAAGWAGMASGGIPAITLLLVAYRNADILSSDSVCSAGKFRLRSFLVMDVIDGARLLREEGRFADLSSADLSSANLYSADLSSANLYSANLSSANLSSANLYSADLSSANLYSANLSSADLRSADLRSANLSFANLRSANLSFANLRSANGLTQAQLDAARTNRETRLPPGLVAPGRAA